jgi:hypothetical protein
MPESTLPERVTVLEQKVELVSLRSRVGAVELQIVQLRDEMRVEFSAVRAEIREGDEETRRYMRVLHEEVLSRIATLAEARRRRRR